MDYWDIAYFSLQQFSHNKWSLKDGMVEKDPSKVCKTPWTKYQGEDDNDWILDHDLPAYDPAAKKL